MKEEVRNTLSHVAWPVFSIAVVAMIRKARRLSWRDDFALRWPSFSQTSLWLVLFAVLFVVEEVGARAAGIAEPEHWGTKYSGARASLVSLRLA